MTVGHTAVMHRSRLHATPVTLRRSVLVLLAALTLGACGREAPPPAAPAPRTAATAPVVPPPMAPVEPVAQPPHDVLGPVSSAACLAGSTATAPSRAVTVHRWVDAAGITHYSDQAPAADVANHRVIEVSGLPPIVVQAKGYDVNLPDQLQQRAVSDALGVQRVLHDALGVPVPAGLTLNIVFVRAADAYAHLIGDPVLASSAGAYSTAQRTIYVRMQPADEASFAVLRHEITHALVHEAIGNLSTPINEGLAEYFGRYRVGGLGGQVDLGANRKAISDAAPTGDGSDALVDLLARDGDAFYAPGGASTPAQRYLRAYALIAVLMRDASGRTALAAVLAEQQKDPCRPVVVETRLGTGYPGGLQALATAWAAFMRDPPIAVQAY